MVHVPYQGSAPAILSVAGRHVALAIVPFPDFLPFQDLLRILAQTGAGIETEGWVGIFAPPETSSEEVARLSEISGRRPSGPETNCEMSDLSRYGDPVLRHERCMRRITHSGSQYLRCSAFNPDKTAKAARHEATTGFTPCPPQRRRFCERPERPCPTRSKRHSLQLVSASTMASCSRCYFECFIRERLGEYGRSSSRPSRIVLLGTTTYSISKSHQGQHGGTAVDFIERWFGVSPDGGDGTLELLYIGVSVLIVVALLRWFVHRVDTAGLVSEAANGQSPRRELSDMAQQRSRISITAM